MGGPRVAIVGGGLAGAGAAWALARRGAQVTLCEREPVRGAHASGRNAGLIRRVTPDPLTAALLRRGAELLLTPPEDLAPDGAPLYRPTGSLLLALGPDAAAYRAAAAEAAASGLDCAAVDPRGAPLRGIDPGPPGADAVAVRTAEDGVADPHAVLGALWRAAAAHGARLELARPARVRVERGRAVGVETAAGLVSADVVLLAAGPWAAELGAAAGGLRLPLVSYRRHLFWTGPLPSCDPQAPWVWDVSRGVYLRTESHGLLLCACDQDPRPPEDAQADPGAREQLAARIAAAAPALAGLPVARAWAGLRGFVPDGRFVIGADPLLPGLAWLTALGGHGLTAACAAGELCARALLEPAGASADPSLEALAPARFVGATQEVA